MIQKVLKVGTSAAVTIPKEALQALKIHTGDTVTTAISEKLGIMVIKSAKNKTSIDLDIIAWTKTFVENYGDALRRLAKK